jgi:hypothetical protein
MLATSDTAKVSEYVLRFPDMRETVNQVVRVAREHLPEAQLEMVMYTDPEIDDSYLVLYARFPEYTPDVMERIRAARHTREVGVDSSEDRLSSTLGGSRDELTERGFAW